MAGWSDWLGFILELGTQHLWVVHKNPAQGGAYGQLKCTTGTVDTVQCWLDFKAVVQVLRGGTQSHYITETLGTLADQQ